MKKNEILVQILTRARRNTILVETYLKKAGVPVSDSITLQDLNALMVVNPELFSDLMDKLFPDAPQVFGTASATGSFDWKGLVGGILGGAGQAFLGMSDTTAQANATEMAIANAEAEKALAEQKAASTRNTIIIVLGVLVLVVVAGVFIFKKRF